ncbi:MAG: MFS transporter [Acidobacteriia bacterium]|nr:MFS transporter [Terriglobia bacterium]
MAGRALRPATERLNAGVARNSEAPPRLTGAQKRVFWAAWGGWTMDGMDSFILSLVLVPALRDVLPNSGIAATPANVGFYGGLLFALFMVGWGTALVWGPVADRFGRARTLMLTILWFSLFTFLAAGSQNVWALAIFRFLAGVGIGGEWSIGASLVSEEWPEQRRTWGACLMHTGYYFGLLLAALANYFIGTKFGWRWMFVAGGCPALLVAFLYNKIHEPARWKTKRAELGSQLTMHRAFVKLFSDQYRRRTILNSIYLIASIVGLWAGSVYVPSAVTYLAERAGRSPADVTRLASWSTAILGVGTIVGALLTPLVASRVDRRTTLAVFFALMLIFLPLSFGYVFYMGMGALGWFLVSTFFLGIGGANFAVYSFWIPEQYETECRVSAFAFTTNIGRFAGAGLTFLVGTGIRYFGSLGTPVALTAVAFVIALLLLPLGAETKGKALPS